MIIAWTLLAIVSLWLFFGQKCMISPTAIFFGYFAVVYPIAYLLSYEFDIGSTFFVSPRGMPADRVFFSFVLICLALVSFCFARFAVPIPRVHWPQIEIMPSRVKLASVLALLTAALSAYLLVSQLGGLQYIFTNLGAVRSGELRGLGVLVYAVTMLVPTALQLWLISCLEHNSQNAKLAFLLCICSCLLGGALGFRGPVITLVIQTLSISYLMRGRPRRKQFLAVAVIGIPIFSALGFLRVLGNETARTLLENADAPTLASIAFDSTLTRTRGVESLILMTSYIDHDHYHLYGYNITETLLSVVPSFVIDKGISLSERIGTDVYGVFLADSGNEKDVYGGVSYTWISEGYWNLGVIGVVVSSFLAGYVFRIVEHGVDVRRFTTSQIIVFKAFAGAITFLIEAPQLGVNAICMNLLVNFALLIAVSIKVFPAWEQTTSRTHDVLNPLIKL